MKVLTPEGYLELTLEHEGKTITVKTLNGDWKDAICRLSRNKESCWKVTFDNGQVVLMKRNQKLPVVLRNFDEVDTKTLKGITFMYVYQTPKGAKVPKNNFTPNGKIQEYVTAIETQRLETKEPVWRIDVKDRAKCYHIEDCIIGG